MSSTKTLKANKKKCDSLQQYPLPEKLRLINGFIISQLDWLLAWQNFELKKARKKAYFRGKMITLLIFATIGLGIMSWAVWCAERDSAEQEILSLELQLADLRGKLVTAEVELKQAQRTIVRFEETTKDEIQEKLKWRDESMMFQDELDQCTEKVSQLERAMTSLETALAYC